jgi:hypothetical protein
MTTLCSFFHQGVAFMTSLVFPSSPWLSPPKAVLTLALLASQMAVQAAAPAGPPAPAPGDSGPVIVSSDRPNHPPKHRHVKPGPVKPESYPSQPQHPVRNLR